MHAVMQGCIRVIGPQWHKVAFIWQGAGRDYQALPGMVAAALDWTAAACRQE